MSTADILVKPGTRVWMTPRYCYCLPTFKRQVWVGALRAYWLAWPPGCEYWCPVEDNDNDPVAA